MKNNFLSNQIIILCLFIFLLGSIFVNKSFAAETTISNDEQRYIDEVLSKLSFGMTKEEVAHTINQPYRDTIMRIDWHPPHAGPKSRVQAYFINGKLFKIVWLKITGFMRLSVIYERVDDKYR